MTQTSTTKAVPEEAIDAVALCNSMVTAFTGMASAFERLTLSVENINERLTGSVPSNTQAIEGVVPSSTQSAEAASVKKEKTRKRDDETIVPSHFDMLIADALARGNKSEIAALIEEVEQSLAATRETVAAADQLTDPGAFTAMSLARNRQVDNPGSSSGVDHDSGHVVDPEASLQASTASQTLVVTPSTAVSATLIASSSVSASVSPSPSQSSVSPSNTMSGSSLPDQDSDGSTTTGVNPADSPAAVIPPVPVAAATNPIPVAAPAAPVIQPLGAPITTPDELALMVQNHPSGGTWYLVTRGREPGIYDSWPDASPLVTGVAGAVYIRCASKELALANYRRAYDRNQVARVP